MILVLHIGERYQSFVISSDPFLFVILVDTWAPCDELCSVDMEYWDKCEEDTFLHYNHKKEFYCLERQNLANLHTHRKTKQKFCNHWTFSKRESTFSLLV